MRSLYASVLASCLAGQVSSVPLQFNYPIDMHGENCATASQIEGMMKDLVTTLNAELQKAHTGVEVSWANVAGPQQSVVSAASTPLLSGPADGANLLCPGKFFVPTNIAGHSCHMFPGGDHGPDRRMQEGDDEDDEIEDSYGESLAGFTEADCTAHNGYWESYICDGVQEVMAIPELPSHPELLDFFMAGWAPNCCSDEDQGGLNLAANNAGGSANTFQFNTQNLFSNQNIFGDAPEGTKVFTGHLVVSVDNPVALIGNATANNTVKAALKAGIAVAVKGVEVNMVQILSVRLLSQRRLAGSSRRLSGDLTVNYIIKTPQDSSLTSSQIGAVGDQFTTAFNSQFQNAGIVVAVAATQSPAPTESVVSAASTSIVPASTSEGFSFVDACRTPAASSALAMALMIATVAKAIF